MWLFSFGLAQVDATRGTNSCKFSSKIDFGKIGLVLCVAHCDPALGANLPEARARPVAFAVIPHLLMKIEESMNQSDAGVRYLQENKKIVRIKNILNAIHDGKYTYKRIH